MIYTRNKDSFKTKNTKSNTSSRQSTTVSQNGFNLVEELKQRIENKHKPKNQPLTQDNDFNTQKKTQSKSPKKITISKNLQPNIQNTNYNSVPLVSKDSNECTTKNTYQYHHHEQQNKNEPVFQHNPFSKIRKQPFQQLVDSSTFLNPNKSHHSKWEITQSNKINLNSFMYPSKNSTKVLNQNQHQFQEKDKQYNGEIESHQYKQAKYKQIYESPIQNLRLSQYSSNGRKTEQNNQTLNQQNLQANKQVYENKVKKWKNQQKNYFKHEESQTNKNQQFENKQRQGKQDDKKQNEFGLISGVIRQAVICQKTFSIPKISLSAEKQYLTLLETETSELKTQLFHSIQKIKHLQITLNSAITQNHSLKKHQDQLTKSLYQNQKTIHQKNQNSYLLKTYERLFSKMRNLHILNAMEMIETKNFLEVHSASIKDTSQINTIQQNIKTSFNQNLSSSINFDIGDCQSRIESINQCIAKVQEMIEVAQKVVQLGEKRPQQKKDSYFSEITIKQLEESIIYKDKIIKKLKEELKTIKNGQNYSSLSQTRSRTFQQSSLGKPYSFVDEIHLLRHQITRLTQQNCHFYQKYFEINKKFQEQNKEFRNFPNQSRIQQIQGLINKLDNTSLNQQKINSKVEYWVNGKTGKQTTKNIKKSYKSSQNNKQKTTVFLQKPIFPKFQDRISLQTSKDNNEKIINYHSIQKYSSNSKDEKLEFSKEQFFQLVKQFKSSLSSSTPQKNIQQQNFIDKNKESSQFEKQEELLTFRTPKQQRSNPIQNSQQQNMDKNEGVQNYTETISRLEYEKEFLASEREALLRENENLIEKISQLQNQMNSSEKVMLLKQQIYKLKLQNQELVERVVETQNILLKYQQNKEVTDQQKLNETLKQKQTENSQLKVINQQLSKKISCLEQENINLTQNFGSKKLTVSQQQGIQSQSYVLAPSFQLLINFLRKLPQQKREYHQILLKMIQGYEKKVSQLRQQNVAIKTKQKRFNDILVYADSTLNKVFKFFTNDKIVNQNIPSTSHNGSNGQQLINKLTLEVKKALLEISQVTKKQFSQVLNQVWNGNKDQKRVSCWMNRINYHLMFLRSLIEGIGESDLELIEGELSDYLKQLRKRIPTVLEREEYEESNLSSLNGSVVNE